MRGNKRRTGSVNIEVDVDVDICEHLDCVKTEELIEELKDRDLTSEIMSALKEDLFPELLNVTPSILDSIKLEIIVKNYMSKTIEELEEFFK